MLDKVFNIFRIPDLRNKILFTVALLIIYRVGFHIPVPGFDQSKIAEIAQSRDTETVSYTHLTLPTILLV